MAYTRAGHRTGADEIAARAPLYLLPAQGSRPGSAPEDQWRTSGCVRRRVRAGTYDRDEHDRQHDTQGIVTGQSSPCCSDHPRHAVHLGLLPAPHQWSDFLAHLEYLVLDELHMYRGVFGSHTALVLRRLLRLCEQYGARPTVIACSATIGNPGDLARQLTGRDCQVIDSNGAPAGTKHVVVWNPPLTDAALWGTPPVPATSKATYPAPELVSQGNPHAGLQHRAARGGADPAVPARRAGRPTIRTWSHGWRPTGRLPRQRPPGDRAKPCPTLAKGAVIAHGPRRRPGSITAGSTRAVNHRLPRHGREFRQQAGRPGVGTRGAGHHGLPRLADRPFFALHPEALWTAPVEEAGSIPKCLHPRQPPALRRVRTHP